MTTKTKRPTLWLDGISTDTKGGYFVAHVSIGVDTWGETLKSDRRPFCGCSIFAVRVQRGHGDGMQDPDLRPYAIEVQTGDGWSLEELDRALPTMRKLDKALRSISERYGRPATCTDVAKRCVDALAIVGAYERTGTWDDRLVEPDRLVYQLQCEESAWEERKTKSGGSAVAV